LNPRRRTNGTLNTGYVATGRSPQGRGAEPPRYFRGQRCPSWWRCGVQRAPQNILDSGAIISTHERRGLFFETTTHSAIVSDHSEGSAPDNAPRTLTAPWCQLLSGRTAEGFQDTDRRTFIERLVAVSYTHLTLPTNRKV